jgi:hypothetical protein
MILKQDSIAAGFIAYIGMHRLLRITFHERECGHPCEDSRSVTLNGCQLDDISFAFLWTVIA